MQCKYCKGHDLVQISFNYYECASCGKLNYEEKSLKLKHGHLGELYFAIGVMAAAMIITILILLFVTAAGKRSKTQSSEKHQVITTEKR